MDFIGPGSTGLCPHCAVFVAFTIESPNFNTSLKRVSEGDGSYRGVDINWGTCPSCQNYVFDLITWSSPPGMDPDEFSEVESSRRIYPLTAARRMPSPNVPEPLRKDYSEAVAVSPTSRRAAAALGRRCLEMPLRANGFKQGKRMDAIRAAEQKSSLPARLTEKLHVVRQLGNIALHVDSLSQEVELAELDLLFDTLDEVFRVFYEEPVLQKAHDEVIKRFSAKMATKNTTPTPTGPHPPAPSSPSAALRAKAAKKPATAEKTDTNGQG